MSKHIAALLLEQQFGALPVWCEEDGPEPHADWARWCVDYYERDEEGTPWRRVVDFVDKGNAQRFKELILEAGRATLASVLPVIGERDEREERERQTWREVDDRINRRELEYDTGGWA